MGPFEGLVYSVINQRDRERLDANAFEKTTAPAQIDLLVRY